jgi:hypothetical protein
MYDSYEKNTIQDETLSSGDSMAEAEVNVDTASASEPSDEELRGGSQPVPEPVDTSVEGLPMPESTPKEQPFPANPDAAAAQAGMPESDEKPAAEENTPPQADMPKAGKRYRLPALPQHRPEPELLPGVRVQPSRIRTCTPAAENACNTLRYAARCGHGAGCVSAPCLPFAAAGNTGSPARNTASGNHRYRLPPR